MVPSRSGFSAGERRGLARFVLVARWWPATTAVLAGLTGITLAGSAIDCTQLGRVAGPLAVDPASALAPGHVLAAVAGAGLLVLAGGLVRGKRRAAELAAAALAAAAILPILDGGGGSATALAAGLAGLMWATRGVFARGGGATVRRAGPAAIVAAIATYAVAVAALASGPTVTVGAAAVRGTSWLLGGTWWLRSDDPVSITLDALFVATIAASAWLFRALLRPAPAAEGHTPAEHWRAVDIVGAHAGDSLDPFALREDKAFHFAAGGMLAYRTLQETAVVAGDPIGPPGTASAILASFQRFAVDRGWDVVLTGASSRHLADYRAMGLRALCIGEEAVVDPRTFSLEGRAIRKVRQSVARVAREGWAVEVVDGDGLDARTVGELEDLELTWRASQRRLYGFAMTLGRLLGAEEQGAGVYVLARDPAGRLRAFIRFATYPAGLSLDVMRRPSDAPNGLMEALVVAALVQARERGCTEVSLNFAGFAHVMAARPALTRGQRTLRWLLSRAHGRFQLERLVRFNEKFQPAWRPRYLVHRSALGLPLAGLRVLQAEAYLRPPRSRPLSARWRPAGASLPRGAPHAVRSGAASR